MLIINKHFNFMNSKNKKIQYKINLNHKPSQLINYHMTINYYKNIIKTVNKI